MTTSKPVSLPDLFEPAFKSVRSPEFVPACETYTVHVFDGREWIDCMEGETDLGHAAAGLVQGHWTPEYQSPTGYLILCQHIALLSDGTIRTKPANEDLFEAVREYCNDMDEAYPDWADDGGFYASERAGWNDPYVTPDLRHPDQR